MDNTARRHLPRFHRNAENKTVTDYVVMQGINYCYVRLIILSVLLKLDDELMCNISLFIIETGVNTSRRAGEIERIIVTVMV